MDRGRTRPFFSIGRTVILILDFTIIKLAQRIFIFTRTAWVLLVTVTSISGRIPSTTTLYL